MPTARHFRAHHSHASGMKPIEIGGDFTHADPVPAAADTAF
jgi:hypothetical protein